MKLDKEFYKRDTLTVAKELVGKVLVHVSGESEFRVRITETEAYISENDTACHASRGRTKRTDVLYQKPGTIYVYLCYGIHWLMNIVTEDEGFPAAVLLRAGEGCTGPGRFTKAAGVTGEQNKMSITDSGCIWIEDDGFKPVEISAGKRIGIGYASKEDQDRPWRFILKR